MSNDARAFLDTAYVYALINSRDQWHARAKHWELAFTAQKRAIVTSEFILMNTVGSNFVIWLFGYVKTKNKV